MADHAKATFGLRVIASDKTFFSDRAQSLTVQTLDGQQQFLAHHAQIILAVDPGELRIVDAEGNLIRVVAGFGTMIFANNRATVLVDTCETQEELDERRAAEALERAKERMRQKQSLREYMLNKTAMARAMSRLQFKGKNYR